MIFFTDHKLCVKYEKGAVKSVKDEVLKVTERMRMVPVGIGSHINIRELERINNDGRDIIHVGEYEYPENVGKKIMHGTLQTLLYCCELCSVCIGFVK